MPVVTFDTLKFSKALRDAGVSERQADAEANVLAEAFSVNLKELVSKDDLKHAVEILESKIRELEQRFNAKLDQVKAELNAKIDQLRTDLNAKIDLVRTELSAEIKQVKTELGYMKWMLGVVLTVVVSVAIRLFFFSVK